MSKPLTGMFFAVIVENVIKSVGRVECNIGEDAYLCQFDGEAPYSAVLSLEALRQLTFFHGRAGRDHFINTWSKYYPQPINPDEENDPEQGPGLEGVNAAGEKVVAIGKGKPSNTLEAEDTDSPSVA